jgi:hypothetical protein
MTCEKAAEKVEKKRIQQNQAFMRTGTQEFSTMKMSHSPDSKAFFAISTGYTTTTLYHF